MKKLATLCCKCMLVLFCHLTTVSVNAQGPVVKIDLNMSGRPDAEVNEPGYTSWIVKSALADTITVNSRGSLRQHPHQ